ncbi:MAG: VOC family protein [Bacteroidota bacterium]
MSKKIFVNLAVKDLNKSVAFFTKLGYTFNQQFTDETATCMVVSEEIYFMLLTEDKFKSFTKKQIADTSKSNEAMLAMSADSKEEVDSMVNNAIAAGATEPHEAQDLGFMYSRIFYDLDGHHWEYFWMDPTAIQG